MVGAAVTGRVDEEQVKEGRVARYDSFLLRVWRSNRREGRQLAARIEHLQDGESVKCLGIDALLDHLRELLEAERAPSREIDDQ